MEVKDEFGGHEYGFGCWGCGVKMNGPSYSDYLYVYAEVFEVATSSTDPIEGLTDM